MRVFLGERGKNRGFSEGRNNDVSLAEDDFGEGFPEPGGRTGNFRDSHM